MSNQNKEQDDKPVEDEVFILNNYTDYEHKVRTYLELYDGNVEIGSTRFSNFPAQAIISDETRIGWVTWCWDDV